MNKLMELLKKLFVVFKKYPWTTLVFAALIVVMAVLYVFFPDTFAVVYDWIMHLIENYGGDADSAKEVAAGA